MGSTHRSRLRLASGPVSIAYRTRLGCMIRGRVEAALTDPLLAPYLGQVQLIFTSPPFPLTTPKRYGNETGDAYREWLAGLAPGLAALLTPDGSIVIEMGNTWVRGQPVMSTLGIESLIAFRDAGRLHLCEQFVYYNPTRLQTPTEWVSVQRVRVTDAYSTIWWLARTPWPAADNRRVLRPYSRRMRQSLARPRERGGVRPSGHRMKPALAWVDHGGSIPSNVIVSPNTQPRDRYQAYCRSAGLPVHPARMPAALVRFFLHFLTTPGQLVLDPFGGSNTTGAVAEELGRQWVSIESCEDYIEGSRGRFESNSTEPNNGNPDH